MGAFRRLVAVPIAGVLAMASTMVASAQPPGTVISDKGFEAATPAPGYKYPPAFYTTGQAFSVAFTLNNESDQAVTECFIFEVYFLPGITARQDHDEDFFYSDIPTGQQLVFKDKQDLSFKADETKSLTRGGVLSREGYYQFDFGFCSDSPLLPKPGWEGPLVSGFVRALTPSPTPTPTPTPPPSATASPAPTGGAGGASDTRPASLAITGGAHHPSSDAALLALAAWILLLAALAWRLLARRSA